jgi:hypothetical protein
LFFFFVLSGSTNGCTVIAALVAIAHIRSSGSVPDDTINEIIDNKSPVILSAVRRKLALAPNALIIPSDVHDYMIDEGISLCLCLCLFLSLSIAYFANLFPSVLYSFFSSSLLALSTTLPSFLPFPSFLPSFFPFPLRHHETI